jgi:hypothetical protein
VEQTSVKLIQLPFDPQGGLTYITRFKSHEFRPAHTGVTEGHHGHKLVATGGQKRRSLCYLQKVERGRDHLLWMAVAWPSSTFSPSAATRGGIGGDDSLVDGIGEDEVKGAPPGLDARLRVAGLPLAPLPGIDVHGHNVLDRDVAEGREQMLLDMPPVVLQSRGVWGDALNLIFDGGVVDTATLARATAHDDELDGLTLLYLDEASTRLRPSQTRRLEVALSALADGRARYLEFGRPS